MTCVRWFMEAIRRRVNDHVAGLGPVPKTAEELAKRYGTSLTLVLEEVFINLRLALRTMGPGYEALFPELLKAAIEKTERDWPLGAAPPSGVSEKDKPS